MGGRLPPPGETRRVPHGRCARQPHGWRRKTVGGPSPLRACCMGHGLWGSHPRRRQLRPAAIDHQHQPLPVVKRRGLPHLPSSLPARPPARCGRRCRRGWPARKRSLPGCGRPPRPCEHPLQCCARAARQQLRGALPAASRARPMERPAVRAAALLAGSLAPRTACTTDARERLRGITFFHPTSAHCSPAFSSPSARAPRL